MRAIDLYSGAGGWSLGLALAGINVVASYERFEPANETNRRNNRHRVVRADIRSMPFSELPTGIDLVVGSPPCTQFSYSNKGGGGDVVDGLKDIARFLKIVDHIRPKFWVMENVPRVAAILEKEIAEGGALAEFAHLGMVTEVVNMEEWGLPQRRKRCIAGNINFRLLKKYGAAAPRRTLGEIVSALAADRVVDPIYGISMAAKTLQDHVPEPPLNDEEVRVNEASKIGHTVYNSMSFPDPLDRSVRTITATCTRVSRESVVIADPSNAGSFRRLTLRERASLQGFPINFQFYASSHGRKATMIGNAVPPLFSYYVARACQEVHASKVQPPSKAIHRFRAPASKPPETKVEVEGHKYPSNRTFKFAIPGFNFKSGVRFELSNKSPTKEIFWNVSFYFGDSKDIRTLELNPDTQEAILEILPLPCRNQLVGKIAELRTFISNADIKRMQDVWARKGPGGTRPFDFLDQIAQFGTEMASIASTLPLATLIDALDNAIHSEHGDTSTAPPGRPKLERLAPAIVAGAIMGSAVNAALHPTISHSASHSAETTSTVNPFDQTYA